MTHLDAALNYAGRGWPVFPLQVRGKRPLMPGGYHRATTDSDAIRTWWNRWPEANIGIPCNEATFCVIDVDPKSGGDASLATLTATHGPLPETLLQHTGGGGAHYMFRPDPRVGNSTSRVAPGIDTRGNNKGYVAVAPSIHECGRLYAWHDASVELAAVPEWIVELLAAPTLQPVEEVRQATISRTFDTQTIERARAYLHECDAAVQGAGGHAKLLWACTALVHGYELDDETAFQLLVTEYNPRCSPPWDLSVPAELRDFRRKIGEGRKEKRKPRGWLLAEAHSVDDALLDHARDIVDNLISNETTEEHPAAVPEVKQLPFNSTEEAMKELPLSVLQPPGLVGDIATWINTTARKPQPLLALATSYAFCGALFGRKVRDDWNLRTNIYCLGVAESGAGKDHSRQVIKALCAAAGIQQDILGGEEVTSDSAIASRLEQSPAVLFLFDEIGHMLASIADRGASMARKTITPYLMRLTGSASGLFCGKEFADGERIDIVQPCVCIYGTTVPGVLYQGLSSSELRDGLLGRLMVFRTLDDDPDINDVGSRVRDIPPELVTRVQAWAQFQPSPPADTPDIARTIGVYQVMVPTSPEAQQVFLQLRADVRRRRNEALREHSPQAPLWSRVEEHARRVALIIASGDCMSPDAACITQEHAEDACRVAMYCTLHFIIATAAHIADSETERWVKRILLMVQEGKSKGTRSRAITRRTQALSKRMREDILMSLLESGEILKSKPKGQTYSLFYAPPYGPPETETT